MDKEINEVVGLGKEIHEKLGIDHNYVLNRGDTQGLFKFASLFHSNGRFLEASTTAPGVQLYTANYIDSLPGKAGATYQRRQGLCLETQTFPNSINIDEADEAQKDFAKGRCFILRPGNPGYLHETVYSFGWKENI